MTEKSTPGPWLVSRYNERRVLLRENNREIALCGRAPDARLIAQAPNMADFCRQVAAGESAVPARIASAAAEIVAKIDSMQ